MAADNAPSVGNTPTQCAAAQARNATAQSNGVNDNYYLVQNDVDSDAGTFNSSTSRRAARRPSRAWPPERSR